MAKKLAAALINGKRSKALAAALLAVAGYAGHARAAPVTMMFEGVVSAGGSVVPVTPYSEVGFTLTNSLGTSTDGIFDAASGVNTNGTDIFGWCASCSPTPLTITLTKTGGGVFSLLGFDTAILELGLGPLNVIDVIGHLSGGGTVTTTITQTAAWTTQTLGYLGVTSVDFAFGPGHSDLPNHAFDNLTMDTQLQVPEPGGLALLGLGLAGLWAGRRRK